MQPNKGGRPRGVTMPCGWGCGAELTASEMRAHFTTCPKKADWASNAIDVSTPHSEFQTGSIPPELGVKWFGDEKPVVHPIVDHADEDRWESRCKAEFGKQLATAERNISGWKKMTWKQRHETLCDIRERGE